MIRSTLCVLSGIAAACLISTGTLSTSRAQEDVKAAQPVGGEKVTPFKECAKSCDDCARICDECGAHCGKMVADGKKHHLVTMQTCQDCAEICSTTSRILSRNGPFSALICLACADACKRCGDECEKHGADDRLMKACAEECRRCEKACRVMLQNSGFDPNVKPKR